MPERFSDQARRPMALASLGAVRLSPDDFAPAHPLPGLIAEGHGVATETLRTLGVEGDRLRTEVGARITRGQGPPPSAAATGSRSGMVPERPLNRKEIQA